jgi:hypothetical protein
MEEKGKKEEGRKQASKEGRKRGTFWASTLDDHPPMSKEGSILPRKNELSKNTAGGHVAADVVALETEEFLLF